MEKELFLVSGFVDGQGQMAFMVWAENSDEATTIATEMAGGNLQVSAIRFGKPKTDKEKADRFNMIMGR